MSSPTDPETSTDSADPINHSRMSFISEYDDRYTRVRSGPDWDELLDIVAGFHDGVVREFAVRDERYVDLALSMNYGSGRGTEASFVVQFQRSDVPALELVFTGIQELRFSSEQEVDPGTASWHADLGTFTFLTCSIKALGCVYRVLDVSYLGHAPQFWSREDRPGQESSA